MFRFIEHNLTITLVKTDYYPDNNVLNIGWDSEAADNIDYYVLQLNSDPSMLIKNTSAQVFIPTSSSGNTIEIKAIDKCAREGKAMQLYLPGKEIPSMPTPILQSTGKAFIQFFIYL